MIDFGMRGLGISGPKTHGGIASKKIDDDGIEDDEDETDGAGDDEEERGFDKDMLKKMLQGSGMIMSIPGATPMNTQMEEDDGQ